MLKFIVIRRDNIGDLVCTTPMLRALRMHYPDAHICVLVNSYNVAVLANNPDVNAIYIYTKLKHRAKGASAIKVLWERARLLWWLRRSRFDYAIVAGAHFLPRAARLARAVKPRHIVGFVEDKRGHRLIDIATAYDTPCPMHEVEDTFRILAPLGIAGTPPRTQVYPDGDLFAAAQERIRRELSSGRVVGVHIGARERRNRWPAERFLELIRSIKDTGFVLFWSPGGNANSLYPGDDASAQAMLATLGDVPVIGMPTPTIADLIAGIAVCDAMVGCDGGALHIAAALDKPVLGLYCDNNTRHWYPWGVTHVVLSAPTVSEITLAQAKAGFAQLLKDMAHPLASQRHHS